MGIDINQPPAQIKRQVEQAMEREQSEKKRQGEERADAQLDQRARLSFFAAHPGASEAAYQEVAADLKRQIVVNDALDRDRSRQRLHSIYNEF